MRKEISIEELANIQKNGPNAAIQDVQVNGLVVIKDKDGNVKGELQIVSLETNREFEQNAT